MFHREVWTSALVLFQSETWDALTRGGTQALLKVENIFQILQPHLHDFVLHALFCANISFCILLFSLIYFCMLLTPFFNALQIDYYKVSIESKYLIFSVC